jgi:enoyl-CoA hydratase
MPGGGATQRLPRTMGKVRTMEMVLLGEPLDAWQALGAGLVNRVVPDKLVLTSAMRLATNIAAKSLEATTAAKSAVLSSFDLPTEAGLNAERAAFDALFDTADAQEGMTAFLEKRKPHFGRTGL